MSQRTNLLQTIWLSTHCLGFTAKACMKLNSVPQHTLSTALTDQHLHNWAKRLIAVAKVKVKIDNPFNVTLKKGERYIIMCNHTSLFDIPLSFMAFPNETIRMLAKKELTRIPIFNRTMKKTRTPIINRHNREQAIKDMAATKSLMDEGMHLWMAPEGTRSKTGQLQDFKKGGFITAIQTQANIVPLAIKNADKIYQRDIKRFNINEQVELVIGEPIASIGYTLDDKETLRLEAHKALQALLRN